MSIGIHFGETIANRNDGAMNAIERNVSLSSTKIHHCLEFGPFGLGVSWQTSSI